MPLAVVWLKCVFLCWIFEGCRKKVRIFRTAMFNFLVLGYSNKSVWDYLPPLGKKVNCFL